jgi:hypothetical protein
MKKTFIYIILFIFPFVACDKDIYFSTSLIGKWSWISTCGGVTGACETPKSTNRRISLVFASDSICYEYQNDTLASSKRFYIYKLVYPNDPKDTTYLLDGDQIFSVSNSTLYLSHYGADYGSYYERIRY